ncbi:MAG: LEA type 2 family protein [Candidatus Margulisiibacteriota bacterium]|jgi:LEA14-like dessication related protein
MKTKLTILLLAITALIILPGCVQPQSPTVEYRSVVVKSLNFDRAKMEFDFDVTNPNPISVDSAKYDYSISVEGREILRADNVPMSLPANSTKRVILPVEVKYVKVFESALGLAQKIIQGQGNADYELSGKFNFDMYGFNFTVPFSTKGQVALPRMTDIPIQLRL